MNINLDVIRAILQSCQTRNPSALDGFDDSEINRHKRMLLYGEFGSGTESGSNEPNRKPAPANYSIDSLTASGQHLLSLLSDETILQRTKHAQGEIGSSRALSELFTYARSLSPNDRNA
jgi:hypothetical protein